MEQKAARVALILLYCAAAVGALWIFARFLLPWTAPFLVAFLLAALMEPAVRFLIRRGIPRGAASGMLTLFLLALLIVLAVWLVSRGVSAATDFARRAPMLMQEAGNTLARLELRAREYIRTAPAGVSDYLENAVDAAAETLYRLPAVISQWALDAAARVAQNSPGSALFAVTAGIGTYFISAAFPRTVAFVEAQLPAKLRRRLDGLGRDLKQSFGGWFRAQLILMAMTFGELLTAFLLLRVGNAAGIAAVTAFVDALPVFGTGIVLVPWAVYSLLLGDVGRGLGLIITWGAVNLVRSCAQAKLLGDQIGLDPLSSLLAVYIGWKVWGVWGMIVFPILFVSIRQLNSKGVIRLWQEV